MPRKVRGVWVVWVMFWGGDVKADGGVVGLGCGGGVDLIVSARVGMASVWVTSVVRAETNRIVCE